MFAMFETKLSWESPMSWLVHTHSRGCRGTSRCCKQFLCSVVISGEKPLQSRMFRCQVFLLGGSLEIKGLLFRYSSYSCPLPLYTHAWSIPAAVNSTDPLNYVTVTHLRLIWDTRTESGSLVALLLFMSFHVQLSVVKVIWPLHAAQPNTITSHRCV